MVYADRVFDLNSIVKQDAVTAAPQLLGGLLSSRIAGEIVTARITEVEAYRGPHDSAHPDPGSHSFRGKTPRTAVMFGPPGHLYVYFTYGMYFCANIVCSPEGTSSAVLLRAGEVVVGQEIAERRRIERRQTAAKTSGKTPRPQPVAQLASGPARLAQALALAREANGAPIRSGQEVDTQNIAANQAIRAPQAKHQVQLEPQAYPELFFTPAEPLSADQISSGPRVGVSGPGGSEEYPWRFWITGDPTVSPYRAAKARKATGSKNR